MAPCDDLLSIVPYENIETSANSEWETIEVIEVAASAIVGPQLTKAALLLTYV